MSVADSDVLRARVARQFKVERSKFKVVRPAAQLVNALRIDSRKVTRMLLEPADMLFARSWKVELFSIFQ